MNLLTSVFPVSGQSLKFDWISLVFMVLFLLAVIWGIHKGFLYSLLGLVGLTIIFFAAYLLSKPIGAQLQGVEGWNDSVQSYISNFLIEKGEENQITTGNDLYDAGITLLYGSRNIMKWVVNGSDLNTTIPGTETTILQAALNQSGIPSFLHEYVGNFVMNALPESGATQNIAYYISYSIASLVFVAIAFAAVFIVGYILLIIAKIIAKKINHAKVVGPINRILGGVLGALIGIIDLALLSALLVSLSAYPDIYNYLDSTLYLSDSSIYTIGKTFYNNNFLEVFMGYYNSIADKLKAS